MSEQKSVKKEPIIPLIVYSVMFYSAWTLYHFFLKPVVNGIDNEIIAALIGDGLIKNLIWTVPAIVLITKYKDYLFIKPNEMFKWNTECVKYLLIFPFMAAYVILGIVIHGGDIKISVSFSVVNIITVLFVGVTEEFVFRGWLLNASAKRNQELAIGINAVMFLAVHFPKWIAQGEFITNFASFGFLSIILLSCIFSYVFINTKNIILPILMHMFWDLLIFMLY